MGAGRRIRRLAERAEGAAGWPVAGHRLPARPDPHRPGDRRHHPVLETARSEGFKGLNDLCLGADGSVFFTDQGQTGLHDPTGRVYRLWPDGRLELLIGTVPSPNGIVVAPDLSHLLVAVTRANQVWRLPLHGDGAVTKAGIFVHLHGGPGGPDGLAWDPEGNLLVAHTGIGTIWRLSPRAEPTLGITSCAGASTTNLCLNGREVFITESETGSILRARLEAPAAAR